MQNYLLSAVTSLLFRALEMTPRVWLTWELPTLCIGVVFVFAALVSEHTGSAYPDWLKPVSRLKDLVSVPELHDVVYDLLEGMPVFPSPGVSGTTHTTAACGMA